MYIRMKNYHAALAGAKTQKHIQENLNKQVTVNR